MSGFIWSNENVFKLIELFQERELLWNTQMDDYRDRNKKHDAWMQIANEFNLDRHSIEKKMRSLTGQFQREIKKTKSGAGSDNVTKWFAYKKLLFLKDRNKTKGTVDGGLSSFEFFDSRSSPYDVKVEEINYSEHETDSDSSPPKRVKESPSNTIKQFRVPPVIVSNPIDRTRDDETFGKFVASVLGNLRTEQCRRKLKRKIQQIILEIEEEEDELIDP